MEKNNQDKLYRLGAGIILINKDKKIFVGQRIDMAGKAWQMPQGGIDPNENEDMAVLRELEEETGIPAEKVLLIRKSSQWLYYDLPDNLKNKIWEGKYKGQKQIWFAFQFLGNDEDINLKKYAHPEFKAWKWLPANKLVEHIVPFKKDLYKEILKEFDDIL